MDRVRPMKETDFPALAVYWALAGSYVDPGAIYPLETSYVYERSGQLLYAVATYQIKGISLAYVEALIRNPHEPPDFEALSALQAYIENSSRSAGYTKLVAVPRNEALAKHYARLGYNNSCSVIYTLKEL